MARPIIDVARELAEAHRKDDPDTKIIKLFAAANDEIRLLEVSNAVPAVGEVLPFRFSADPANGIEYPSTIILLSPFEWQGVQQGQLQLPQDWNLALSQDL